MKRDNLGNRMKEYYEDVYRIYLTRRTPLIIRIDGRSFHSYTKDFKKPFDIVFKYCMWETALNLCKNIQNTKLAYVQSDEISLLLIDFDELDTEAWFKYNLQKIVSVSAAMATLYFNKAMAMVADEYKLLYKYFKYTSDDIYNPSDKFRPLLIYRHNKFPATFDSRAFNVPKEEVCNYFIFRQNDATNNSINMIAQSYFDDKELQGINTNMMQNKLLTEKDINYNNFPTFFKRGICVKPNDENKWEVDTDIPIFKDDRNYVERYLHLENC